MAVSLWNSAATIYKDRMGLIHAYRFKGTNNLKWRTVQWSIAAPNDLGNHLPDMVYPDGR